MAELDPIEIESTAADFKPPTDDKRPKMPEPLPVRLIAVADVAMPAQAGLEPEMDQFYEGLLQFQRDRETDGLVYNADNFRLIFDTVEGLIERKSLRPQQIEILSLNDAELKLVEREIEYVRQRGITPGTESIVLQDPSGNWVELVERRDLR